jgi:CheY-like chemotaxis protein
MPTRVLILENDQVFASELANGLRALGAEASVVEDPSQGLQLATTERPQLIVLAVELHKMNGFSVCSRIKKEPGLSSIPVVLVTSNSTEVTIDQHRQRPNHADDYVRKPIAVPQLLDRLRKFINLAPSKRPSVGPASVGPASVRPGGDEEFIIDDEVLEIESRRSPSLRPMSSVIPVDSDVSTFTDNAFDDIMTAPPAPVAPSRPDSVAPSAPRHSQAPGLDTLPTSSPSVVPPSVGPNSESARMRLRVLEDALEEAQGRIRELEAIDLSAKEAELEQLRRELDEARAKLIVAGRGGTMSGSTAREVLDLREQLHKKEKELLDLRDRVTQRDKELLGLKDNALAVEREKADLSDRLDDIARQLTETQRIAEAARSDKEAANKRSEDAKRRLEKLTAQLEEKAAEIDQQRSLHETALNDHAAERARLLEERELSEQRAAEELRAAMARASAEINQQAEKAQHQLAQALAAAEQQSLEHLQHRLSEAAAAAEQQQRRAVEDLTRQLEQERAEALSKQERELTERLNRERAEAIEHLNATHNGDRERLEREHAGAIERLREQSNHELEQARAEGRHALEQAHAEAQRALEQLHRESAEQLENARGEFNANLERARSEFLTSIEQARLEREELERARDERVAALDGELQSTRRSLTDARDRITILERLLDRANAKWIEDKVNIERTKDALAAALVQLEAIEQRPLET